MLVLRGGGALLRGPIKRAGQSLATGARPACRPYTAQAAGASAGLLRPSASRLLCAGGVLVGGGLGLKAAGISNPLAGCPAVQCEVVAVGAEVDSYSKSIVCPLGHGGPKEKAAKHAPSVQHWTTKVIDAVLGAASWSFVVGMWTSAILYPVALTGALLTARYAAAGVMIGLMMIPRLVEFPRFRRPGQLLRAGMSKWQGPPGTVRFVDLSRSRSGPPTGEPEPEPSTASDDAGTPATARTPRMYCAHPHGILGVGIISNVMDNIPGLRVCGGSFLTTLSPVFSLCSALLGCKFGSVSPKKLAGYMRDGEDILIVPGGFHEATISCVGHERVFLKSRKGFVKYALRHGYDMVPVYTFGENDLYWNPQGGWGWRLFLNSWLVPAVLPCGFPLVPLFPRRGVEVVTVMGPPVRVPRILEPSREDVAKYHAEYVKAVEDLFAQAGAFAPQACKRRPLEIW